MFANIENCIGKTIKCSDGQTRILSVVAPLELTYIVFLAGAWSNQIILPREKMEPLFLNGEEMGDGGNR